MSEGGFFEQKRSSPGGLAAIVLLHAALLGALMLAKSEMPMDPGFKRIKLIPIAPPHIPPPIPQPPQPNRQATHRSVVDHPDTQVPTRSDNPSFDDTPVKADSYPPLPEGPTIAGTPDPQPLPPLPLRIEARIDAGRELQPPYPPSEERAGREGSVSIRILIGADGRVKSAEKVSATSDAFYRATERQAFGHWRFHPATIDGKPIESRKLITVTFRLND